MIATLILSIFGLVSLASAPATANTELPPMENQAAITESTGVDLDWEFNRAARSTNSILYREPIRMWDGSNGLPPIVNQNPLGSCQSFAMAAWLEYLFFYRTGQVIDLSEKALAYNLIRYMIDEFYDTETDSYPKREILSGRPELGNGIAPYMIESLLISGVIPDSLYSFGQLSSGTGSLNLDLPIYFDVFEKPVRDYTRAEYLEKLDDAFFAPPPTRFNFKFNLVDYSTGSKKTEVIKTPHEMIDFLEITREQFQILYNSDLQPFRPQWPPETVEHINKSFKNLTAAKNFKTEIVGKKELLNALLESLNRRMVVMIAADVWTGSWTDDLIFKGGGGHAMVIVGYQQKDGHTFFKIRNSWGPNAGIEGYNYVDWTTLAPNLLYVVIYSP